MTQRRLALFDSLRGLALILMAIFHFSFDLAEFKVVAIDFNHDPAWLNFRTLIMTSFTFLVGVSFYLGQANYTAKSYRLRLAQLAACAAVISLATYLTLGRTWIFFGVLHFIFVASLLGPLARRRPIVSLIAGAVLIAIPLFYRSEFFIPSPQNIIGLATVRPYTEDFAPLMPWLGVTLIGVFVGSLAKARETSAALNAEWRPLSQLGRHSLAFYMLHQLVLYPIAWLLSKIL